MPKKSDAAKTPKAEAAKAPKKAKKASAKADLSGAALVIVESPAKERTISRFLNKKNYVVKSSYGHVRDLPVKRIGVAVEDGFAPEYVVLPRAKKILAEFKPLASKSPAVYLATDPDREGESIAWHLSELLKLKPEQIKRITFHEITPGAIEEAIASPREIDTHLVQAQQARRVIDRLVGYKLSPLLWEKIQSGLSAGRVQSVAVRLLSERDNEIAAFKSETYFTIGAILDKVGDPPPFEARLHQWKGQRVESTQSHDLFAEAYRVKVTVFRDAASIEEIKAAVSNGTFKVTSVERKEVRRGPPPPFATSTMQQAASQKLGFSADRTMRVAQSLYEGVDIGGAEPVGLITYMRTDSFFISKIAGDAAAAYVKEKFGATYAPAELPQYQTKSRGAQEAHEGIRPTDVRRAPEDVRAFLNPEQSRLYELIWKRFVASQMSHAVYDTVSAEIGCGDAVFKANGRILKFEGFLRVYGIVSEDEREEGEESDDEKRLPPLSEGDTLNLSEFKAEEHSTSPPPYYNEASLIKALEKHGIGRPSTYAPTIKTIVDRGYVRRNIRDRRLIPTDLGKLVTEKLKAHFPDVVSLSYTAEVEGRLDRIAEGQDNWTKVVEDFYSPFNKSLEVASREMPVTRPEPKRSGEKCPICSEEMLIRESRFGKYLSCSQFPRCKGKVPLTPEGERIAVEKTGEACDLCGKDMVIRTGRKGRFIACSGYPACKNTYSLDAEGKKIEGSRPLATSRPCQKCGSAFWLRLGKRGHFLACSGFPKCRNIKPVGKDEAEKLRVEAEAMLAARKRAQQSNPNPAAP